MLESTHLNSGRIIEQKIDSQSANHRIDLSSSISCDRHAKNYLPSHAPDSEKKQWLPLLFDIRYFAAVDRIPCTSHERRALHASVLNPKGFGNLPFSSAVYANHHVRAVQQMQEHNLFAAPWEMRTLGNAATPQDDPFEGILAELLADLSHSQNAEELCGPHAFIGALDDEDVYMRAPKLSQIVASIAKSIRPEASSSSFTQYAIMHWHWALLRWMLEPIKRHYYTIPETARPTARQLFVPHARVFDFLIEPALREFMCRDEPPNVQWLTEATVTIQCDWQRGLSEALCKDGRTMELDLTPISKVLCSSLTRLTMGSCYH